MSLTEEVQWKIPLWYKEWVKHNLVPGESRIWFQHPDTRAWQWGVFHPTPTLIDEGCIYVMPDTEGTGRLQRAYQPDGRRRIDLENSLCIWLNEEVDRYSCTAYLVDLSLRPEGLPHERRLQRCMFCNNPTGEFCDPMFEVRQVRYCPSCRNLPDAHGRLTNIEHNPVYDTNEDDHEYPPDDDDEDEEEGL